MKKWGLLILTVVILLCSCSKKEDNKEQIPVELKMIKSHFSAIYKLALTNDEFLEKNEESAVVTSLDISSASDYDNKQIISFDKNHYYIKECLKSMENIRVVLSDDGIENWLINGLDNTVNRMAHYMNVKDEVETMRAANDGIYIISAILEQYNGKNKTDILKLEYCLNLIETESKNEEKLNSAVELTKTLVQKMRASDDEIKKDCEQILKSLESIKSASMYSDEQLIRMKVGIIREKLNKIADLE
ncbi:MAG: hypothetical protein II978_08905 [Clostridia bacterium]|nr:hypothetical protein [Clostridia bacterium]